jgi:DNA repair photolyase
LPGKRRISGTKEWSVESVNILLGCPHKCRYCYARANALRRRQVPSFEAWGETYLRLREKEVTKRRKNVGGTVMFPTTHDIVPQFLDPCLAVMGRILDAGNRLLVVSKPHLACIEAICDRFAAERPQILFRFSIGAMDNAILAYWEPGAPTFEERLACLRHACEQGFATSVSCEPLLDSRHAVELFRALAPYTTDSIWIGKMNGIAYRLEPGVDAEAVRQIEDGQADDKVRAIYAALKDEPKVRWKDSYKQVLGLALADEAGLDR